MLKFINTHTLRWFALAATVLLLDQLTKLWVMTEFTLGDSRYITGFFNLVSALTMRARRLVFSVMLVDGSAGFLQPYPRLSVW